MNKLRVLFIAPLPPPVHGSAMVSQYIKDSQLVNEQYDCDFVNLSTSRRMDEIGKGGVKKILRFVGAYLKTLWLLLTHRYDLCYLAITCHGIGFLKDAPFVWLCKMFGRRIVIHQHNKGMGNCIDRWPYRWLIPYIYKHARVILLSWHLYPDIAQVVKREQVVICPNGIAAEQQVNCDDSQVNVASPRLNAAEQQVNCDASQVNAPCAVNVALPRLNAAEQQVNSDESQVKSCVAAVKGDGREVNQSQGDDSPATPLRLTISSAAINRSTAASLTAHRSPLTVNLLFLSNLIPSKGVYVLLDACKMLKDWGLSFQCNFVGGETKEIDRATFEGVVRECGLEGVVCYHGPKYGEEKEMYWQRADVFVQPTYEDCFPLTIVEAMQHGKPVVSTDEGAVPDIVLHGVNGFVCQRQDVDSLAEALKQLINDPVLRHQMGEAGYARYKEHYTLEAFERRLVECL